MHAVLRTGDRLAVGPQAPGAASVHGRLHDSLWIAWTFTFYFNWVAFLWIGARARNRRWQLWALVYALPFLATIALADNDGLWNSWPGDAAVAAMLLLGVTSIVHAFAVRRTYIAQRQALLTGGGAVAARPVRHPAARGTAVVGAYLVLGLIAGSVVALVAAFSDPCLPFCVADQSGYARGKLMDAIVIAGAIAYLALIVPMTLTWGTRRVWWVVLGGGFGVSAVALLAEWLTISNTGAPAFCNC